MTFLEFTPLLAQVQRRAYADFTREEFFLQYVQTRTPVIITGLVEKMTSKPWTLDYMKEVSLFHGEKVTPHKGPPCLSGLQ